MQYEIEEELRARGYKIQNLLPIFSFDYYVAGNCLNATKLEDINDIDIFPAKAMGNLILPDGWQIVAVTKNATTITNGKTVIQVCKYYYPTLQELVESFDYAHIQVGFYNGDIFYTDDWITANSLHTSWYTGSEYPLSSVIRSLKYYKYGQISNGKAIYSIIRAITDIIKRGYSDYEDFKNQIDAVDLGLVAESASEANDLTELFEALKK